MTTVFISYARDDRPIADALARALEEKGFSVWWDRKISVGGVFDAEIERQINAADWVVVLWSSHSVDSEWVKSEAAYAAERNVLLPIIVERVRPPLAFRLRETIDLLGWAGDVAHEGFTRLIGAASAAPTHGSVPPQEQGARLRPIALAPQRRSTARRPVVAIVALALVGITVAVVLFNWSPNNFVEKKPVGTLAILDETLPQSMPKDGEPVTTDVTVYNAGQRVATDCHLNWYIFRHKTTDYPGDEFYRNVDLKQFASDPSVTKVSLAGPRQFSLLPNERTTVTLSYGPGKKGAYRGFVELYCADPDERVPSKHDGSIFAW
jgi:hypothetical protein